jgi:hypothetical protein
VKTASPLLCHIATLCGLDESNQVAKAVATFKEIHWAITMEHRMRGEEELWETIATHGSSDVLDGLPQPLKAAVGRRLWLTEVPFPPRYGRPGGSKQLRELLL